MLAPTLTCMVVSLRTANVRICHWLQLIHALLSTPLAPIRKSFHWNCSCYESRLLRWLHRLHFFPSQHIELSWPVLFRRC